MSASELDRVSSAGYAIGYLGGGVLLAVNLLMIQRPAWFGIPDAGTAVRLSLASVGIWWLVFSIPLFRTVPEPARRIEAGEAEGGNVVATGARRLGATFHELRRYKQAFLLLVAFLVYNDGIQTIIRMATTFGSQIGIDQNAMITALLITQFIGVPFAFLFGMVAERIGAKTAVFVGLGVYAFIITVGYYMTTALHFYALAIMVGMVQGGTQALSRSLFASMIPRHKSSEFFAFFGVFERYAGILGPLVFAAMVDALGRAAMPCSRCSASSSLARRFWSSSTSMPDGARRARPRPRPPDDGDAEQSCRPLACEGGMLDFLPHRLSRRRPPARCGAAPPQPSQFLARSRARLGNGRAGRALPRQIDALRRPVRPHSAAPAQSRDIAGWIRAWTLRRTSRRSPPCRPRSPPGTPSASFPEGISHSTGRLEALRTGAARMTLDAERRGTAVALVPVGLNFDRKSMFRSRVMVVFGHPFSARDLLSEIDETASAQQSTESLAEAAAVKALTARIAERMRGQIIEADPTSDAALVYRVDRLYTAARARPLGPAERLERRRIIAAGMERLRQADPSRYEHVLLRLRRYDQRMQRFGLRDRHLNWQLSRADVVRFAVREICYAILLLPLCIAGLVVFFLPYQATWFVARRVTDKRDVVATAQVFAGAAVYSLWLALLGVSAWWRAGMTAAILTVALLPVVAVAAVVAIERESAVIDAVRSWWMLRRTGRHTRERLRRRRSEIADLLDEVYKWLETDPVSSTITSARTAPTHTD